MKIRWSIVFLAIFGVVAALGAAVLAATLSAGRIQAAIPDKAEEKKVDILVAARDLPARTTLTKDDVVKRTVLEKSLIESHGAGPYLSDPAQVVGKLLTLAVKEEQMFTRDVFPSDSHGLLLAEKLPKGKRAVTIALNDYSGLEGLLYPGCIVDVVASFRVESNRRVGQAISTTLLQNIEVLGVEGNTIVDKSEDDSSKSRGSRSGMRRTLLVTLMVDSRQAEALQLAMEHGAISLAMRNPGDVAVAKADATLLSEGNLAQLAAILEPKTSDGSGQPLATEAPAALIPAASQVEGSGAVETLGGAVAERIAQSAPEQATPTQSANRVDRRPKMWRVDVLRGLTSETRSFPVQN